MGNIDFRDPNVQIATMVIAVAVTIGYVFFMTDMMPFGFKVQSAEIARLEGEYETLSADLMKAKQTASRLPQVRAEYEELAAQWEEAKRLLPTTKEVAELLTQVTVAGQRSGVDFSLFEPRPPVPREIYMENPVDVKVHGGYHEIGLFLSRLTSLPRIVNVNSIELKTVSNPVGGELPDVVEANMKIAAYTLMSDEDRARMEAANQPANKSSQPKGVKRGH